MPGASKKITFWVKLGTFGGVLAFIAYTLRREPADWHLLAQHLRHTNWTSANALLLLALTPLNWSVEALKWQWLVRPIQCLRFTDALGGVLAGLSLSMALPGPLGDTVGRVLSLQSQPRRPSVRYVKWSGVATPSAATPDASTRSTVLAVGNRLAGVGAAMVAGGMQFYVAIVVGAAAWATYLTYLAERRTPGAQALLALLVLLGGLGMVLNFQRHRLVGWSRRWPWLGRYVAYWAVIGQYTHADMAVTFGLALLRHLIFSAQLYLAFRLYGIALPGTLLAACVGVIYLVKTIAPAFNWLSDLGVREAAALWVFAPLNVPAPLLLTATLTLWLVNILLPVLVGLGFVGKTVSRAVGK